MTICFLNHDLNPSTGAGRFGKNLIGRLEAADSHIRVIVLTTVGCGDPRESPILFQNWFRLILAIPRIRRVFRNADIIHALDGYPYGVIAVFASLGLRKKVIITAIGTGAIQPLSDWRRPLMRWAYRKAARVIAVSRNTRREILAELPDLDVAVVNHAVDADEFLHSNDDELTPQERATIASLEPYIMSVGGWKKRKGFEYSFSAYAEVRKHFSQFRYVICGIGPKPHLESPLGLHGSVHYFKGVRWQFLKALYRHATLFFLLPVDDEKDIEGFGFAFLEAAASGLPVIGTRDSGAEDSLQDGINGFLVPPRDVHAAAEAIEKILASQELQKKFSSGSRAFSRAMNWSRVLNAYFAIYHAVLGRAKQILTK